MKNNTVVFLTSGHSPLDDRIFYHQAKTLHSKFNVVIIASTVNLNEKRENITIFSTTEYDSNKAKKIEYFIEKLKSYEPCVVFCSEPLPILAAAKYKRKYNQRLKIVFDVTEWYPSKKNLEGLPLAKKIATFSRLLLFNIYTSSQCNGFIFGEYYKSLPYKFIYPFKDIEIITYFPDLNYIHFKESKLSEKQLCLGYTGTISIEKGIKNFFNVAFQVKQKRPDLLVKLKIIGMVFTQGDREIFQSLCREAETRNIVIEIIGKQGYEEFSVKLQDIDILFDLRKSDFENNHCLPIKVFYYAACGKPVIYTDLKAIKREIDISPFGYLVNPMDSELISDYVINYIENPSLYDKHSRAARKLAVEIYNWKNIEPLFENFLNKIQS